jgi:hypothetical protein
MTTICLLLTEPGRLAVEVGHIHFYAAPLQKEDDFECAPRKIVSFADARAISIELAQEKDKGQIGRYGWRKEG